MKYLSKNCLDKRVGASWNNNMNQVVSVVFIFLVSEGTQDIGSCYESHNQLSFSDSRITKET